MKFAHIEYSIQTKSLDIFSIGCNSPHCKDCCNPELWNFELDGLSTDYVIKQVTHLIEKSSNLIDKIILVGGDPIDVYNKYKEEFTDFLVKLNRFNKPIFIFTKHEIQNIDEEIYKYVNYIKTGAYIPELKCDNNIQYGIKLATSNQKIVEVKK